MNDAPITFHDNSVQRVSFAETLRESERCGRCRANRGKWFCIDEILSWKKCEECKGTGKIILWDV